MSKKVSDLVKTIQDQLKDSLDKKYVSKSETKPPKPNKPAHDKNLGDLDDNDVKEAVKYAVEGKWQGTDNPPNGNLRVKGDKMVKAVTNLKKIEPKKRG